MARPAPATWLPLWERALEVEIGIAVPFEGVSREYFRNELYAARKTSSDPQLQELIMFLPSAPYEGEVWICKKEVELDA